MSKHRNLGFARPGAFGRAVAPLSAETVLSMHPQDRDRANFQRWPEIAASEAAETQPLPEPLPEVLEETPAAPEQPRKAPTLPNCRGDVLPRIIRLLGWVYLLATNETNDQGGAYARNIALAKLVRITQDTVQGAIRRMPDLATIRRWLAILEASGWIQRVGNTRGRLIEIRFTLAELRVILGELARYLPRELRGMMRSLPIYTERSEGDKNIARTPRTPKKPLSVDEERVVVQAAKAGMIQKDAEAVVRSKGVEPIKEALEVLEHKQQQIRAKGKTAIDDTGAYLASLVKRAIEGTLKLPKALLQQHAERERREERNRAAANKTYRAEQPTAAPTASVQRPEDKQANTLPSTPETPIDSDIARLLELPGELLAALEARANEILHGRGGLDQAVAKKPWQSPLAKPKRLLMLQLNGG